ADHLDRHPNVEAYGVAKSRIFENQEADDWKVINADDPAVLELARHGRAQTRLVAMRSHIESGTAIERDWIVDRSRQQTTGLVPIIGGKFKGGDLRVLRNPLKQRARAVIAIGEAAPLVKDALDGAVPVHEAKTFESAVREAFTLAKPDGVVLLAPACASFDM